MTKLEEALAWVENHSWESAYAHKRAKVLAAAVRSLQAEVKRLEGMTMGAERAREEVHNLRSKLSTAKEDAFREALDAWATELNRKCGWAESRVAYSCWLESKVKGGA